MSELLRLKRAVDSAQKDVEEISKELKAAKAWWETCVQKVLDFIEESETPNLFNRPAPPPEENGQAPPERADQPPEIPEEERWRSVPIGEAIPDLTPKVLEKLTEAELLTVGDLAAFTAQKRLTDIKGIGEAKAELIEKGMERFWERRRAEAPPPVEPQGTETPPAATEQSAEQPAQETPAVPAEETSPADGLSPPERTGPEEEGDDASAGEVLKLPETGGSMSAAALARIDGVEGSL